MATCQDSVKQVKTIHGSGPFQINPRISLVVSGPKA